MNDFTREELGIILDYIREIHRRYEVPDRMVYIENKVKSMLHNYASLLVESKLDSFGSGCLELRERSRIYCLNGRHDIDKEKERCKTCGLPTSAIPCVGGWL